MKIIKEIHKNSHRIYRAHQITKNLHMPDNILNRNFTAEKSNQKWVSDINYILTDEGHFYLAHRIMNLYEHRIVEWAKIRHMRIELVMTAINQSVKKNELRGSLLIYSNRGIQYASN